MGKGKMSLLDVRAMVKELKAKLIGLRVANIYHLSDKTFLLRLSGTDIKQMLLVESGVRLHTTKYAREHDKAPSNFCAKLRKHLRMLKLEDIAQVGNDRIVDLQFGRGDKMHHLILEFYDQGNIILTDAKYEIIMLLRVHTYAPAAAVPVMLGPDGSALPVIVPALGSKVSSSSSKSGKPKKPAAAAAAVGEHGDAAAGAADESEDRVAVREQYPMSQVQMPQTEITLEMIQACMAKQFYKEQAEAAAMPITVESKSESNEAAEDGAADASGAPAADAAAPVTSGASASAPAADSSPSDFRNQQGKKQQAKEAEKIAAKRRAREAEEAKKKLAKPKMKQGMPIKAVLAQDLHFGPDVIEECLMRAKIDPNQTLSAFINSSSAAADSSSSAAASPVAAVFSPALLQSLCTALQEAPKLLDRISTEKLPGYIFWKIEQQAPVTSAQQQQQQPKKPKPQKQKRDAAGELVVDEIDVGATVAGAVAAAAASSSASAAAVAPAAAEPAAPVAAASVSASPPVAAAPAAAAASSSSSSASAAPATAAAPRADGGIELYTEYVPVLLACHSIKGEYKSLPAPLKFDSFDEAMDEFYSKQESQKEEVRLIKEKAQALQKLEREKQRQATQLAALATQQSLSVLKATLIEQNLAAVNACIGSVNAEIAKGTDWRDLTRMIKEERSNNNNPIAKMIHSLKLLENQITILLSEGMAHLLPENAGNKSIKAHQIEIDLGLSAFSNAQLYYDSKRKHALKQSKAESASSQAIKAAERKTNQALSSVDIRSRIQKVRKIFWWEKFHWFISSENFLVIGGKDMQQNENLVKKYLKPGDSYVHAEIHGASSVIVKNHTSAPIPALTLSQAGSMTICRSNAWKEKVLVQAYWVHADQVSKTPPTGLSLPTGSFMIRGRKNFLPSMPLQMGIGLLWKLDDSCRAKHAGERKVRAAGEAQAAEEDKFDQVAELPGAAGSASAGAAGAKGSSSSKKKKSSGGAGSNKKKPAKSSAAAESSPDFDVTSNLGGFRGPTAPSRGSAPPIGRLTSEDEGTDAEEEEKKKRIAQLAEGGGAGAKQQAAGQKKKLSAAERKKLKKGGQLAGEPAADAAAEPAAAAASAPSESAAAAASSAAAELSSSDDDAEWGGKKKQKKKGRGAKGGAGAVAAGANAAAAPAPAAAGAASAPAKPLPRGKRTKLKRTADRYKNQDEDDLVLAASLLGLQNVDKKKQEVKQREKQFLQAGKAAAEEESSDSEEEDDDEDKKDGAASSTAAAASPAAAAADDDSTKVCFLCKSRGHVFKACPSRSSAPDDVSFASLRRAAETAEEGEVAKLMAEEGIAAPDDDAAGSADSAAQAELELSGLTGRPLADDQLHFALPVCAPYDALAGYKFKLKLLPGAAKKGKAAKQALQLYMATDKVTPQETDLLKLVPEQELINVLLSNIKLSYPGQQDGKKKTKNKPKAGPGAASSSAKAAADDD